MPHSAFANQYQADQQTARRLLHIPDDSSLTDIRGRLTTLDDILARYVDNPLAYATFQPSKEQLQRAVYEKRSALQLAWMRQEREEQENAAAGRQQQKAIARSSLEQQVHIQQVHTTPQQPIQQVPQVQHAVLHRETEREEQPKIPGKINSGINSDIIGKIMIDPTAMLLQYYQQQGIIGEEKNCILQTLCLVRGLHVGIEGYSGSGKTRLADALLALVPKKIVYRAELQSPTALWYDAEHVNNAAVLYIPELQKAYSSARTGTPMVSEIIKNLTEGRKITRRVTMPDKSIEEISLHPGATILYTLALENSFKKDDETTRRFICLQTDDSLEHRERVKAEKANIRFSADNHDNNSVLTMQQYISSLIDERKQWKIKDPYAANMHAVIPATLRGASFAEHYFNLVEAHAYFHRYQRVADKKNKRMFTSIADHLRIQEYYLPQLFTSLQGMDTNTADKHLLAETKKISEEQQPLPFMVAEAAKRMQDSYPLLAPSWENYEQQKISLLEQEVIFP